MVPEGKQRTMLVHLKETRQKKTVVRYHFHTHTYANRRPRSLMFVASSCVVFLKRLPLRSAFISGWCGETRCWQQTRPSRVRNIPWQRNTSSDVPRSDVCRPEGSLGLVRVWSYVWQCVCPHRAAHWLWILFFSVPRLLVCVHACEHRTDGGAGAANSICQVSPLAAAATVSGASPPLVFPKWPGLGLDDSSPASPQQQRTGRA